MTPPGADLPTAIIPAGSPGGSGRTEEHLRLPEQQLEQQLVTAAALSTGPTGERPAPVPSSAICHLSSPPPADMASGIYALEVPTEQVLITDVANKLTDDITMRVMLRILWFGRQRQAEEVPTLLIWLAVWPVFFCFGVYLYFW